MPARTIGDVTIHLTYDEPKKFVEREELAKLRDFVIGDQ